MMDAIMLHVALCGTRVIIRALFNFRSQNVKFSDFTMIKKEFRTE